MTWLLVKDYVNVLQVKIEHVLEISFIRDLGRQINMSNSLILFSMLTACNFPT
jgi:hypothetical protein